MDTIALFGGSFDPPHIGHKAIVQALKNFEYINKIIIMPTFLSPFKSKSFADAKLRFRWLKKMFETYENVEISNYEIKQKQKVPSIKTVKYLLKLYKKVYLVIGADNLASLHKWQNYEELKELVTFIVCTRDHIKIPDEYLKLNISVDISSTQIRNLKDTGEKQN